MEGCKTSEPHCQRITPSYHDIYRFSVGDPKAYPRVCMCMCVYVCVCMCVCVSECDCVMCVLCVCVCVCVCVRGEWIS